MPWVVLVTKRAEKDLKRIPHRDAERILAAIEELSGNPYHGDIEKMEGERNVWRRRVGSYRVFYELFLEEGIVSVFQVERRTSKTY